MNKIVVLTMALCIFSQCYGENADCNEVLANCQDLVHVQDIRINHLRADMTKLENSLVDSQDREAVLPWWSYVLLGALGGLVIRGAVVK